jgi:secreted PhoX family phosphatase
MKDYGWLVEIDPATAQVFLKMQTDLKENFGRWES